MTWTTVDDTARDPGGRPPRSARAGRLRRALLGALLGALLLGLAAAVFVSGREQPVSASALVLTAPDPAGVESPGSSLSGDPAARAATYVETELVILGGAAFADQVADRLGRQDVDLQAVQVGESNVLELTATAEDRGAALLQAQTAAEVYIDDREQRLVDRADQQLAAVEGQIAATDTALRELGQPAQSGFDPQTRQRDALSERYAEQLAARDDLQRAVADAPQVADLVQAATPAPPGLVPTGVLLVLSAAVVGAVLGAAAPIVLGSLGGRVRDEADLAATGAPVLSPPLPGARLAARRAGSLERAVQLQALRLTGGPAARGSLAVLAATSGAGATFTAVQHARLAARRGRTLLICAHSGSEEALGELGVDPRHLPAVDLTPADGRPVPADVLARAAQPTAVPDLFIVSPGPHPGHETVDLGRSLAGGLVPSAVASGWAVVVDTPPLDRSDLGVQAARQCAETVLVTAAWRSTVEEVERSLDALQAAGVDVAGVVLTNPRRSLHPWRRGSELVGGRARSAHHEQVQRA
ncbi:Chromosome partitioning ATPase, Mrp family, contains Fe-S cluster [Geodermatophilus pulveris]|uniref:Chromosome partitioning ATPase, Mrp family, contains Fe-S cluster n=1 Tax=Geodermatophilus pulveris TaxID=1564159 RepID=A0A239J741_9ACTN|nr:hypothetical protein [Geodermatophilus pulveris]SNT01677.1 Chromosome partitioning ATPase, Mrp family, contains Fe-S cluster [Geodermatophilus pulveris]